MGLTLFSSPALRRGGKELLPGIFHSKTTSATHNVKHVQDSLRGKKTFVEYYQLHVFDHCWVAHVGGFELLYLLGSELERPSGFGAYCAVFGIVVCVGIAYRVFVSKKQPSTGDVYYSRDNRVGCNASSIGHNSTHNTICYQDAIVSLVEILYRGTMHSKVSS